MIWSDSEDMAGKGGARPGAGRKKKSTVEEQLKRREIALEVFNADEWRALLREWLVLGKATPSVIYPLLPYILGSPRQEISVTFDMAETANELAEKYGVAPERVVSIVERLKAKQAG